MEAWCVCPRHLWSYVCEPGEECFGCNAKMVKAPLVEVRVPAKVSADSRTRLCPYCRERNVLHTYPGGFKSCPSEECKIAALDDAMEAEYGRT